MSEMNYSPGEVLQFVGEEDIKFVRLAFCDVYGKQKNVAIMASELERAFSYGIAIDASAIDGFGGEVHSDLLLHPNASTLVQLPWRPQQGKVVRMFCDVSYPDGTPFESDTRQILKRAVDEAEKAGYRFSFGSEIEFYLFLIGENGEPTRQPHDQAGYMDIAPEDKGENVRREICLMLEQMGIFPESSHHEGGPGQNEIDFRYSDPLTAADNAITFYTVVKTIAALDGLHADFSPKPLPEKDGNGMHINFAVRDASDKDALPGAIAGILAHIQDITAFLNPCEASYKRLGCDKAPGYVSWSKENRSQLVRIPYPAGGLPRAELRSPDPTANPYLAFALVIYAALDGLREGLPLPESADCNLFTSPAAVLDGYRRLPGSLREAKAISAESEFLKKHLPGAILESYCR